MTEIPEHLLKKAAEAKARKEAEAAAAAGGAADSTAAASAEAASGATSEAESKIPAHLLERAKAARSKSAGAEASGGSSAVVAGGGGGTAVATAPDPNIPTGPGGHTQRLLTVVKSGSIQDVKGSPQDKVHVWPHLLIVEFVSALAIMAFSTIFSIFVNAPLLELANFNQTPNPSKAPWYFLGLQELLTMFHPMVAGVTIPGMGLILLVMAPYMDKNPATAPENRKFAISIMTIHLMFWAVLVIIGSFFRGPGFNFVMPWQAGLFFEL